MFNYIAKKLILWALKGHKELKMPKHSLVIENAETADIIAAKGVWRRLPNDGEPLRAFYSTHHAGKYADL